MTQRGTVNVTARRAPPIASVRPCHAVSAKPASGVSTTTFGRKRWGSNRLPGTAAAGAFVELVVTTCTVP